ERHRIPCHLLNARTNQRTKRSMRISRWQWPGPLTEENFGPAIARPTQPIGAAPQRGHAILTSRRSEARPPWMNLRLMYWVYAVGFCVLCSARSDETTSTNPTNLTPSWETQRQAMAYALAIPAPRGQITDRNGVPLAQTHVSYNLSVVFPAPFDFTDHQVVEFVNRAAASVRALTGRQVGFSEEAAVQHYRNRGVIPFDIATD